MLAVSVEFLTGRFVATAYNTRLESEWPPHPARLFSALVATHFESEPLDPDERKALEWLEGLGAPAIRASSASIRELASVFVPVNDLTVVGSFDEELEAVNDAEEALALALADSGSGKAVGKSEKGVQKSREKLALAVAKAVGLPARETKEGPKVARAVLPEFRMRQPRTFPSVTPAVPQVTYLWLDAEPGPDQLAPLERLLSRVVRLGHSSSFVSARLVTEGVLPTWWPAPSGELTLRVVSPGQLGALETYWTLHRESQPRVMPSTTQAYTRSAPAVREHALATVFSEDWLLFRCCGRAVLPMTAAAGLAATFRRALMSYAEEPIPEFIAGHSDSGGPSQRDHLAIVPLPFVGRPHASGVIMGLALALPRDTSDGERAVLYRAIRNWESAARLDDEDAPALQVQLGSLGVVAFERVEWGEMPRTLRSNTWCWPARVWLSATPVALDRNPGDLRARDSAKLQKALAEAYDILAGACQRIGLPRPVRVEVLPAAPLAGAAKAQRYPAFPAGTGRPQRVLTHARLEFAEPVRGPVLLGAGRYLGLGLFRPEYGDE